MSKINIWVKLILNRRWKSIEKVAMPLPGKQRSLILSKARICTVLRNFKFLKLYESIMWIKYTDTNKLRLHKYYCAEGSLGEVISIPKMHLQKNLILAIKKKTTSDIDKSGTGKACLCIQVVPSLIAFHILEIGGNGERKWTEQCSLQTYIRNVS